MVLLAITQDHNRTPYVIQQAAAQHAIMHVHNLSPELLGAPDDQIHYYMHSAYLIIANDFPPRPNSMSFAQPSVVTSYVVCCSCLMQSCISNT